jgi:PadR family transcriptional regulator, regulatory protein PadR
MMLRDFFLGFIKIHILYHAAREPVYGAALIEELERHGYKLSPGTLYPFLHSLERSGYLVSEERVVRGKVRKYYAITEEGQRVLAELRPKIAELVAEVLAGGDPMNLPEPAADTQAGDEVGP